MSRIATGVSKKINRINLQGLDLFYSWRSAGLVSVINEIINAEKASEISGIVIRKEIKAIELAIKTIKEGNK